MNLIKGIVTALVLTVSMSPAWAKNFELKAGESVALYGDVISCLGTKPEDLLPACTIKKTSYYNVYIGSEMIESYIYMDDAIAGIQKLRQSQLCR